MFRNKPIKRIAVIDIGSNSVRLLVAELIEKINYRILLEEKDNIRLGREVFDKGEFGTRSRTSLVRTIEKYKKIITDYDVDHVRAVATAAFREAANSNEFANYISKHTDLKIEVISGAEEGRLIFLGVSSNFELSDKRALCIDIGGGSCEIIIGSPEKIDFNKSFLLGSTRLTKYFLKSNPVKPFEITMLDEYLEDFLKKIKQTKELPQFDIIIGTGGSLNNITAVVHKMSGLEAKDLFREVSLSEVKSLNSFFEEKTYRQRLKLPGLEQSRADIILAAGKVIEKIMEFYEVNKFTSLDKGLKDGLMIDTINRLGIIFPYQKNSELLIKHRIWEIGNRFNFEEKHAENVTELSNRLFDKLKDKLDFDAKWKEYLWPAAMLHDIGYHIGHSGHHKHSMYMIENSELVGYDEREKKIIANIARYHRKSLPKKSHESFCELDKASQQIVSKMASVLRIADALDRSHLENIHDFTIENGKNTLKIKVDAPEKKLFFEIQGVSKKGDMFEDVFDKKIVLEGRK
jgi:exopolyphosphatase/guanosine-5'-triphosphate,3'-diphosphate pyrophosphatase